MIKSGRSLDDVNPVKTIEHESTHHTIDDAIAHYESKRGQLICEALDKHFGEGNWTPETVSDLTSNVYPNHTEFFADGKLILRLGKLKVTLSGMRPQLL
jgi:hypothetical protein